MADLHQVVRWAIERKCPLRTGDQWFQLETTFKQLGALRSVGIAEHKRCAFRGICVTNGDTNSSWYTGFRIEDRLAPLGGLERAREACRGCEANVATDFASALAGCVGYFDIWPDCEELNQRLWNIIHELNLKGRFEQPSRSRHHSGTDSGSTRLSGNRRLRFCTNCWPGPLTRITRGTPRSSTFSVR